MSDTSDPRDMEKAEGDRDTVADDLSSAPDGDRRSDDGATEEAEDG